MPRRKRHVDIVVNREKYFNDSTNCRLCRFPHLDDVSHRCESSFLCWNYRMKKWNDRFDKIKRFITLVWRIKREKNRIRKSCISNACDITIMIHLENFDFEILFSENLEWELLRWEKGSDAVYWVNRAFWSHHIQFFAPLKNSY